MTNNTKPSQIAKFQPYKGKIHQSITIMRAIYAHERVG